MSSFIDDNKRRNEWLSVQLAVESQYIVAVEIFQNANDVNILIPFLNKISK